MTDVQGADVALPPAQVEELLQVLVKALRAHQLYLPNNPVYQKAIETLRDQFRRAFEYTDDLVLDVGEAELRWEGTVVYSQANRAESLAWVLFKDGVRSVQFLAGFEEQEITALLGVLHTARTLSADANDDLLTLLWEKDFQRFRYQFQDLTSDMGTMELPTAEEVETAVTTESRHVSQVVEEEAPPREGIVRAEDFDTTLYFLDEQEIEYIRTAVQHEYTQDVRRNVLAMLFDVLELQPYPTVRAELISILESFLPYLLGAADFRAVAFVLREVKTVLERAREVLPEHRAALEALPLRLSEEQALSQLLQALDEASVQPSADELHELFAELRADALPTLFDWLPRLATPRVRELVEGAAQRLAAAFPGTVVELLQHADATVVISAARTCGRMRLQPAVAGLGALLQHAEPGVRVTAIQSLAEIASPSAVQVMEKGLDDADREVRLTAVRVITQHKSRSALARVTAVVQGRSVRGADLTEKMAFFEAYGVLAGEAGVGPMNEILNSGGFLKRKEDPQTRACAAMALGKIGSEAARAALEKAVGDKEPLVRSAAGRALRGERASSLFRAGEIE